MVQHTQKMIEYKLMVGKLKRIVYQQKCYHTVSLYHACYLTGPSCTWNDGSHDDCTAGEVSKTQVGTELGSG